MSEGTKGRSGPDHLEGTPPPLVRYAQWLKENALRYPLQIAIALVLLVPVLVIPLLLSNLLGTKTTPKTQPTHENANQQMKESQFDALMDRFTSQIQPQSSSATEIAIGNFIYDDSRVGGPVSRYIRDELRVSLDQFEAFEFLSTDRLTSLLGDMPWLIDDVVHPDSESKVEDLSRDVYILKGRYCQMGGDLSVIVFLLNLRTGKAHYDRLQLPLGTLPPEYETHAESITDDERTIDAFESVLSSSSSEFKVKIWLDRGNFATYSQGDTIEVFFYSTKDCYLRLYHYDSHDSISLFFPYPNEDNFVRGGTWHRVPPNDADFAFVVLDPPYGVEVIKAVASLRQFSDDTAQQDFLDCSPEGIKSVIERGTRRIDRDNLAASTCVFTTTP